MHIPLSRLEVMSFTPPEHWEFWGAEPYPVDEAAHPGERYYALAAAPVQEGDIIRVLR
jgi:hypothetical protein